jgi:hypothetical protein
MMGKKIEDKFLITGRNGPISRIKAIYQMTLNRFLKPGNYLGNLESISYEITKEHKAVMLELERARARAQLEYSRSGIR